MLPAGKCRTLKNRLLRRLSLQTYHFVTIFPVLMERLTENDCKNAAKQLMRMCFPPSLNARGRRMPLEDYQGRGMSAPPCPATGRLCIRVAGDS